MRPLLMLALTAMLVAACAGNGAQPDTTATGEPRSTASPRVGATPLPLEGRVTLYAADPGDSAGTLETGDFNGDGVTDILFATAFGDGPANQRPDAGEAYVFLGPFERGETRDAAAGEQDATIYGADEGDQSARSAAVGDINGDGIDDIILGALFGDGPDGSRQDAGEVHIVFGSPELGERVRAVDLRDAADLSLYGAAPEDLAGFAVAAADVNGDAIDDAIIGAFWADDPGGERANAGAVYVLLGSPSRAGAVDVAAGEQDVTVHGSVTGGHLGESVLAGDMNGDGLDDLVLSAPFAAGFAAANAAGQTYVIYSPLPETIDLADNGAGTIIYGADEGDQLGHSLAVGDVNADGANDILLGAVSADGPGNGSDLAGETVLILGSSLPETVDIGAGRADLVVYGADSLDRLGRSVAIGDIDGDGGADLILASPGAAGAREESPHAGEVYAVTEAATAVDRLQLPSGALTLVGDNTSDALGSSVYGKPAVVAADLDGDGASEIVVAAPLADGPGESRPDCGEAYVLFVQQR